MINTSGNTMSGHIRLRTGGISSRRLKNLGNRNGEPTTTEELWDAANERQNYVHRNAKGICSI